MKIIVTAPTPFDAYPEGRKTRFAPGASHDVPAVLARALEAKGMAKIEAEEAESEDDTPSRPSRKSQRLNTTGS